MSENEHHPAHAGGEHQQLESHGELSSMPPPMQLFASPADGPPDSGGDNFPWIGLVRADAWSSGFYSAPDKASKTADLPKGTQVRATGRQGGWLEVEVLSGDHQGQCGYISQERVQKPSKPQSEPYDDELEAGEEIGPGGPIQLEGDLNGALFYAREGDRIFVVPADKVDMDPTSKQVDYQTLVHSFQDRGASGFTTLFLTYPGDDGYAPIEWYAQASAGGMIDIWGALLEEFAQLIEGMKSPEWNPGKQPPNFYIGNEAHGAISEYYRKIHGNEDVFFNSVPMMSILAQYEDRGIVPQYEALTPTELLARPDITNATLDHLFEIKPWTGADRAAAEVTYYHQIFLKAGIPVQLGPMNDPGAKGAMPMPDGYAVFYSPMPGVILYKYKKKSKEKAPKEAPQTYSVPETAPDGIQQPKFVPPLINPLPEYQPGGKSVWEWEYWEELTGLTGTALLIYLILSEGSRLFPPRNVIPIP